MTVLEAADRVMARVASPEVSAHMTAVHRRHGVDIVTGASVVALHGSSGRVTTVELTDGRRMTAGTVSVGVGVRPRTEVAEACGLPTAARSGGGIMVDERLVTADPAISAIGDCANFPHPVLDRQRVRLESVQNAADQARYVARRLTGTEDAPYAAVPWFWTHQFDVKVQIAGLALPDDQRLVLGDPETGRFSVARFRDGLLSSVESVNSPGDHIAARRLLAGRHRPTSTGALDPQFSLRACAATTGGRPPV